MSESAHDDSPGKQRLYKTDFHAPAFRHAQSLPERGTAHHRGCSNVVQARITDMGTILIIVLLLLLLGAWPAWPHSRSWGYYPSSTLGIVLVVVLVLALTGRI
jgi:MFS superfamily sulfate permease-like transporter